ncbi:acyltransferase 3 [Achlya hypogyna]|uniref:Acyltransferase 3 n=1 Tax=Achlya hypogyna TaxID=1202772 RepID=A0A1V9Y9L1_ACHHY|nr:acyltransferase 3 [Achlya hypogyna]
MMTTEATALLAKAHTIAYRPDIDGLRCFAVIPVVIYHAYPSAVPGGFTGVDIFFVISGFLISSILLKDAATNTFSYGEFYARRIRRIFPALLLVMAFSIVVGCCIYLVSPLRTMAATLWAGAIFGANIEILSRHQDYFRPSTKENPLLHLWSLGVEEQFYIFWPLVISAVVALPPRLAVALQLIIIVLSFALNIGMLGFEGDNSWSFYFPLCRFWQMAIGGLLAYAHRPSAPPLLSINSAALSGVGVGFILYGFVALNEEMAFPGVYALYPTLGAAAIIHAGPAAPVNAGVLSKPFAVFVGKVSYGIYLWHWPLLVFTKARYSDDVFRPWFLAPYLLLFYSFGLSVLTQWFLEDKIRRRRSLLVVPLLVCGMVGMLVMGVALDSHASTFSVLVQVASTAPVAASATVTTDNGVPNMSRPPQLAEPTVAKLLAADDDWDPNPGYIPLRPDSPFGYYDYAWQLNPGNYDNLIIVLGDSHAEMLRPRFKLLLDEAVAAMAPFPTMVFLTVGGNPPLGCFRDHDAHVGTVLKMQPKVVLYSTDWPQFIRPGGTDAHGDNPPCCRAGYHDDCSYQSWVDAQTLVNNFRDEMLLFKALGIKVFAATMNPEGAPFHYNNMLQGGAVVATAPVRLSEYRRQHGRLIAMVEKAIVEANATKIDYADNQCYEDLCQVVSMARGEPVMKDNDHFRPYYAKYYLSVVDQVVAAAKTT